MKTAIKAKCVNKRCQDQVENPGLCKICAEIWQKTLKVIRNYRAKSERNDLKVY